MAIVLGRYSTSLIHVSETKLVLHYNTCMCNISPFLKKKKKLHVNQCYTISGEELLVSWFKELSLFDNAA